jgi:holo-[acyl-carrier protein] synthase
VSVLITTGIDIEEIGRLRRIPPQIRERFVARILTPSENRDAELNEQTIIGLFCVKEAVAKALGCGIGQISWQEIEVVKTGSGQPQVHLSGQASMIASKLGIRSWSISISHTREYAAAIAVGYGME